MSIRKDMGVLLERYRKSFSLDKAIELEKDCEQTKFTVRQLSQTVKKYNSSKVNSALSDTERLSTALCKSAYELKLVLRALA